MPEHGGGPAGDAPRPEQGALLQQAGIMSAQPGLRNHRIKKANKNGVFSVAI